MADQVVGNGTWVLRGTANQNAILAPVFDPNSVSFIAFPWEKLGALRKPVPITWEDLNDGTLRLHAKGAHKHHEQVEGNDVPNTLKAIFDSLNVAVPDELKDLVEQADSEVDLPPHIHVVDDEGNVGHGIVRTKQALGVEDDSIGRFMIAGVFWTDGRIKIDIRMEQNPEGAREVLSAEIAHAVDYGIPFNDDVKRQLMALFHGGGSDTHTWWERADYGSEYYTLVGEGWMALFTHSYSKMHPYQDPFVHKSDRSMAPRVHQILGITPVVVGPSDPPTPPAPPIPPDMEAFVHELNQASLFKRWATSNPGEYQRFVSFYQSGATVAKPNMVTAFGRAAVLALIGLKA